MPTNFPAQCPLGRRRISLFSKENWKGQGEELITGEINGLSVFDNLSGEAYGESIRSDGLTGGALVVLHSLVYDRLVLVGIKSERDVYTILVACSTYRLAVVSRVTGKTTPPTSFWS